MTRQALINEALTGRDDVVGTVVRLSAGQASAVALHRAERNDEARKELDRLLKSGREFTEIEDARALHNQLGG